MDVINNSVSTNSSTIIWVSPASSQNSTANHTANTEISENQSYKSNSIAVGDRRQVEKLIKDYFNALEIRDYTKASSIERLKIKHSDEDWEKWEKRTGNIKFVSMMAFIETVNGLNYNISNDEPTVSFKVDYDYTLKKGADESYPMEMGSYFFGVKDTDGQWHIIPFCTTPI